MLKSKVLLVLAFLLAGCAGSFTSQVSPDYRPPLGKEIALTYLDHADISISNAATSVLENQLRACEVNDFLSAEQTTELLEKNKIELPRRPSESFIQSLGEIIPTRYLLTGGVSVWKKGALGIPVASSTEVSASFTMYDLTSGRVVWTVSGQEEGASGFFAEEPSVKANLVFRAMLRKWDGFCVSR